MRGSGTVGDPYVIENVDDLQAIENDLTAYYELGGDIDASATAGWSDADGTGFIPLGEVSGDYFEGSFDGKGFTISNLFMKRTYAECGLFLQTTTGAVIQNVTLSSVDFTADSNGGAGIVGLRATGTTITNCHTSGTITTVGGFYNAGIVGRLYSGTITNCSSSCTITTSGYDRYTGGVVGYMDDGTISKCYATGTIVSTGEYVGGFAGVIFGGTIDQCYATGNVTGTSDVGGFCGYVADATITNSYARGNATNTGSAYGCAGFTGGTYRSETVLDDCYSTGVPTGGAYNGGFCGYGSGTITNCFWDTETSGTEVSNGGTGKTTAEMKIQSTFTDAGWDFVTPIWYIGATINDGYPAFIVGIVLPIGQTNPATKISIVKAKVNGILIDDGGEACDCGFEWGATIAYGSTTPTQSKITGQTFSQDIIIVPGYIYHFRAKVNNSVGTAYGNDRTFIICPKCGEIFTTEDELLLHGLIEHPLRKPIVTTGVASDIFRYSATPNGVLVDDGGKLCSVGFEWGTSVSDLSSSLIVGSGVSPLQFSVILYSLIPNTKYYFRAFATNSVGTGYGAINSFTTKETLAIIPGLPGTPEGPIIPPPGVLPPLIPGLPMPPVQTIQTVLNFVNIGLAIGGATGLVFIILTEEKKKKKKKEEAVRSL